MVAGEHYFPLDPEIQALYDLGRSRLADYNAIRADNLEGRDQAMRRIFASVGEHATVNGPFFIEYGTHVHIGNCYINFGVTFLDATYIMLGDYTLVGPHVQFLTSSHPVLPERRIPDNIEDFGPDFDGVFAKPITIGEKCWIGAGSIILPGVTIGNGTTVGAGSVVTKSLPARVLALGNPARIVRSVDDE